MKLYVLLVISIVISGFFIIGCASSNKSIEDNEINKYNAIETSNIEGKISKEDAINLVKEYLKTEKSYIPNFIEVDNVANNVYVIHAYDVITNQEESHVATSGWFEVNIYTGKIIDILKN